MTPGIIFVEFCDKQIVINKNIIKLITHRKYSFGAWSLLISTLSIIRLIAQDYEYCPHDTT